MEDFWKELENEIIKNNSPLQLTKRFITLFLAIVVCVTMCHAETLGGYKVGAILSSAFVIWNVFNLKIR